MFHALVGWVIISGAMPNVGSYPYVGNVRYTLQRATGILAFFFIIAHVIHMHRVLGGPFAGLGGARFDHEHAASTAGAALQPLWLQVFYAVGVLATVFHLANGIWTLGITWGIWTSRAAQRRANYVSVVFGLLLAVVGLSALWGTKSVDIDEAKLIEDRMIKARQVLTGEAPLPGANDR